MDRIIQRNSENIYVNALNQGFSACLLGFCYVFSPEAKSVFAQNR